MARQKGTKVRRMSAIQSAKVINRLIEDYGDSKAVDMQPADLAKKYETSFGFFVGQHMLKSAIEELEYELTEPAKTTPVAILHNRVTAMEGQLAQLQEEKKDMERRLGILADALGVKSFKALEKENGNGA